MTYKPNRREPSEFIRKICGHRSEEEQLEAQQALQNYIDLAFEIIVTATKDGRLDGHPEWYESLPDYVSKRNRDEE